MSTLARNTILLTSIKWSVTESLKFVGFAFGPFGGVEFEAYCGRAGGEDGAFDGGFVAALELYFGKRLGEQYIVAIIQRLDSNTHRLLIGKEV